MWRLDNGQKVRAGKKPYGGNAKTIRKANEAGREQLKKKKARRA